MLYFKAALVNKRTCRYLNKSGGETFSVHEAATAYFTKKPYVKRAVIKAKIFSDISRFHNFNASEWKVIWPFPGEELEDIQQS